jgi:GT2 family glycosyltransferase
VRGILVTQVDIIIPNWNGKDWLRACLNSLLQQTFTDFEIILVDNNSTDGSVELVKQNYPQVQVLELNENTGFSGAINRGINSGTAPYICMFNNDAIAEPDFLENLLKSLKAKEVEGFAIAAAQVTFYHQPNIINSAGLFVGADGIGRDRGFQQENGANFESGLEVFGTSGVAALFKREMLKEVGLLDEDFFLYSEDVDLCYRAQLAGYRCLYVPNARVRHIGSASSEKISGKAVRLASRNGVLTIIKNFPLSILILYLPAIILGQVYQLWLFARRKKLKSALLGKLDILKLLLITLSKRRTIQQNRKISVWQLRQQMRLGRTEPRFWRNFKKRIFRR